MAPSIPYSPPGFLSLPLCFAGTCADTHHMHILEDSQHSRSPPTLKESVILPDSGPAKKSRVLFVSLGIWRQGQRHLPLKLRETTTRKVLSNSGRSTKWGSPQVVTDLRKDFLILWRIPAAFFLNFLRGQDYIYGKERHQFKC